MKENIIYTITSPTTTIADVERICAESKEHQFPKICVPPLFIKTAKANLQHTNISLATVIGFPFGYSAVEAKLAEIVLAILDGADELYIVINIAALKNKDFQYLAHELNAILPVVRNKNKILGIMLETGVMTDEEITQCCDLYGIAGVDLMITSTGYAERGATRESVKHIRQHLADAINVVAAGNTNDATFAKDLIAEGAAFIMSDKPLELIKENKKG